MNANKFSRVPASLTASVLLAAGAALNAGAASTPLDARLELRPLTPGDKTLYGLPASTEVSAGLSTVAVGSAVYLEADLGLAIPASNIVSVTWSVVTNSLTGSATLLPSPLPANLPPYEPSDRLVYQVAGRQVLRPDMTGQYTVTANIATSDSGSTNVSRTITVGTYVGAKTCAMCHSGGVVAENKYNAWQQTPHAHIFSEGIDGLLGHYSQSCLACHTVGYDTATAAVNGGFDDVMKQTGWVFPTVQTNGNFASMPSDLQALGNIQCENCHGPGSEHAYSLGKVNLISVTTRAGDCNQCHDAPTHHIKGTEWTNSVHAVVTTHPSGPGEEACVRCHTGTGFLGYITHASTTNTTYDAIGCVACHDPHDITNPHQVRSVGPVTLMNGTVVSTNYGTGALCMNCHMARQNATNYVETAAGNSRFGPHHGPQTDMFLGVNAVTYGKNIPSSAHRDSVKEACVECHMQATAIGTPEFLQAGGHTWKMGATVNGTNVELVAACTECHGNIKTFDFPREDYDGNGIIEGVQTEVKGLLNKLAFMLPPVGQPKTALNITSSWTRPQLKAAYNYQFVLEDGSFGVHNLAYAVGLLKASIADLSGDANNDGIADWWQTQYFGSTTSPNAAPNACPAGDGIPNWLKYSLGLNPLQAGVTLPDGVMWANGGVQGNPTDPTRIYTAAEIVFNTAVGKTYQLQAISSLGGGWVNVGNPVAGTGNSVSFLTPTRNNAQQFYRVVATP